jgi:hypothetical protein
MNVYHIDDLVVTFDIFPPSLFGLSFIFANGCNYVLWIQSMSVSLDVSSNREP